MKDRIPTYPGRVRLTPVSGQENVYDMERADEPTQVGTPLNKETLLTDDVAELFGGDDTWSPNDLLASYGLHRWSKHSFSYTRIDTKNPYTSDYSSSSTYYLYFGYYGTATSGKTSTILKYSDSISVSQEDGSISLVNPSTLTIEPENGTTNYVADLTTLKNKYFKFVQKGTNTSSNFTLTDIYLWGNFTSWVTNNNYFCINKAYLTLITTRLDVVSSEEEIVISDDQNAYPKPNGLQDGFFYSYLGTRIKSVEESIKVKTGSYVGTGVSTSALEPLEWDFEGEPLLLIIKKYGSDYAHMMPFIGLGTTTFKNYAWMYSWSGVYFRYQSDSYARLVGKNHLERYGSNMMNDSNATYYYMLFYR